MRLADFHAHREPIGARRTLRNDAGFRFDMAETVSSAAPRARSCAGRTNADSPEKEAAGDDAGWLQFQMQLGAPRGEEDAELVAEAEAVAAGWMLDFLCLSLCRAFRDGRSEDFRRTRDSAEGECGLPGRGLRRGPTRFPARTRAGSLARGRGLARAREPAASVLWASSLPPPPSPAPECLFIKPPSHPVATAS